MFNPESVKRYKSLSKVIDLGSNQSFCTNFLLPVPVFIQDKNGHPYELKTSFYSLL